MPHYTPMNSGPSVLNTKESMSEQVLKRKKKLPKALKRGKTRASDAGAKPTPLGSYLFWL